jgi:hypothetical protein
MTELLRLTLDSPLYDVAGGPELRIPCFELGVEGSFVNEKEVAGDSLLEYNLLPSPLCRCK